MSTREETAQGATVGEWAQSHWPVVVGVDGSRANRAAVMWAAGEAARQGADLVLATAVPASGLHHWGFSRALAEKQAWHALEIADEVRGLVPEEQVSCAVIAGTPEDVLLDSFPSARMIVVGRRGSSGLAMVLMGSNALKVAGRAAHVVAVVPEGWASEAHAGHPVVVGVDPARSNDRLVTFACHRAKTLGVPLVMVHGWEEHLGAEPRAEQAAHGSFLDAAEVWRSRFPDLEIEATTSSLHPVHAILDAAEQAQLVIIGRRNSNKLVGFGFGSVTHAVLHYAHCPVLVVPTEWD